MRYGQYMKESMRLERLQQEYKNYDDLLGNLTNQWMTYASHKDTGLVYDMDIIKNTLEKLRNEMNLIEELLNEQ